MAQSALDYLMNLVGPSQAEAAPWSEVGPILRALHRKYRRPMPDIKGMQALERLTESYPSVRNMPLHTTESDRGSFIRNEYKSLEDFLQGNITPYEGIFLTELFGGRPLVSSPALSYGHEGIHAFSGGSSQLPYFYNLSPYNWKHMSRAATEGLAEGASHGMLGKYNENVYAPYFRTFVNKGEPEILQRYLNAGELGVELGESLRRGNTPNQANIIEQLFNIMRGNY